MNRYVIFTHDLDFGTLLALTRASSPSVIQVRTQDILPARLGARLTETLKAYESVLEKGALIKLDLERSRVRILPIQ